MRLKNLIPKSEVRSTVVKRYAELNRGDLRKKTIRIIERLSSQDEFIYGTTIYCYIPGRTCEVDTRRLIDFMDGCGKSVIIPKLNKVSKSLSRFHFMGWENLVKNSKGYPEPKIGIDEDLSDVDLVIAPALAVSLTGQRVGYGGGYYDKLLRRTYAPKFTLAFEYQVFDYIETEEHDVRMDKIITERRVINTHRDNGR